MAIASTRELRGHVEAEAPGLRFIDLGALGEVAALLRRNEESASLDRWFARGSLRIVEGLTAAWPVLYDGLAAHLARERPQVMVVDLFTPAGMCAAEAQRVPFVVNNPDLLAAVSVRLLPPADDVPFLFSGRSIRDVGPAQRLAGPLLRRVAGLAVTLTIGRKLNALRRSRGLPPVDIHERLRGRLILVDGAFGLEYRRPLPPFVQMVGPMLPLTAPPLPAELLGWLDAGPPVVYANLGTLAVAPAEQLAKMAEAFEIPDARVLWVLRNARAPARLPPTVRLIDWGPSPLAVLSHPNVRVHVSHCGINAVHESLHAGKPIVGIPMFADQRDMAVRVADAGVGLFVDKRRFGAGDLRGAIARVLRDDTFRAHIPAVQASFEAAGGVRRAADLIEQAAGTAPLSHIGEHRAAAGALLAGER